ncbi:MAG: hypothetical protein ACOC9Y_05855 [Chloroflexota bacterium]
MTNPLSWDYLTAPIREVPTFGPFSIAFLVLFIGSFLIAGIIYLTAERKFGDNRILFRAIRIATQIIMWLTGIGLFFFAFRIARIETMTLYMRFWSYLFLLLYVGALGYFAYWYKAVYQPRIEQIAEERKRRRYHPSAAPRRPRRKPKRGVR